ncbi:hypothetical protein CMQ_5105 [Grosmannia clavigera kw1407]|uniref:Uncharacterized protein n=1 Tax=Grosmannia clavigera (strain kw1407 / UAMH 11150) TaxID=655863 RepID=F0XB84_GROCL|nr:uncharacterized protein CMQ_5105 [Grosmannia clavigera kw1407]EFX04843.1 hypothetical protein CMQ_5105 [Grosmannia clavigera kw1407]
MTPATRRALRSGRAVEMTAAATRPARRSRQKQPLPPTEPTEPTQPTQPAQSRRQAAATTDRWTAQKPRTAAARRTSQRTAAAAGLTLTAVKTEDDDREHSPTSQHTPKHSQTTQLAQNTRDTPPDVRVKIEDDDEAGPSLSSLPYFQPWLQSECHLARAMRGEAPLGREHAGAGAGAGANGSCFCHRARLA